MDLAGSHLSQRLFQTEKDSLTHSSDPQSFKIVQNLKLIVLQALKELEAHFYAQNYYENENSLSGEPDLIGIPSVH